MDPYPVRGSVEPTEMSRCNDHSLIYFDSLLNFAHCEVMRNAQPASPDLRVLSSNITTRKFIPPPLPGRTRARTITKLKLPRRRFQRRGEASSGDPG